jgi:hypothetical protein
MNEVEHEYNTHLSSSRIQENDLLVDIALENQAPALHARRLPAARCSDPRSSAGSLQPSDDLTKVDEASFLSKHSTHKLFTRD